MISVERVLSHIRTPLYKNAYALIFSSATSSVLGLAYWVLAAHFYSAEVVGLNSAIISAMLFLSGLAQLGLNNVMVRFLPLTYSSTYRMIAYAYLTSMVAAVVISCIFLLGINIWSPVMGYMGTSVKWWISFVGAVMAWCIFVLQDSVMTGLRQAIWVPVENTIYAVLKIVLLAVLAVPLEGEGIFISWVIPVILSIIPINLLIFMRLVPRHIQSTQPQSIPVHMRDIVRFASGNYVGSLFYWASTAILPIMVTNQAGARANAYFYPAWAITTGLQFIASNMSISLTVEASLDRTKLIAYSRRVLLHTFYLLVPIVLVILLFAQLILTAFGKVYAAEGATVLRLLALGTLPNILVALAISITRIQNRAALIMLIQGSLCFLILTLAYLLLPGIGINGVGLAWLISQTIMAVCVAPTILRPVFSRKSE